MRTATTPNDARFGGFHSLGDFARSVIQAAGTSRYHPPDERLRATMALETPSTEADGESGGSSVPVGFLPSIAQALLSPASLLGRTTTLPLTRGNQLTFPADQVAPWNTDVGVRVAWQNELNQLAQQRAKLEGRTLRFKKVVALVPCTEELIEDAGALDAAASARRRSTNL